MQLPVVPKGQSPYHIATGPFLVVHLDITQRDRHVYCLRQLAGQTLHSMPMQILLATPSSHGDGYPLHIKDMNRHWLPPKLCTLKLSWLTILPGSCCYAATSHKPHHLMFMDPILVVQLSTCRSPRCNHQSFLQSPLTS